MSAKDFTEQSVSERQNTTYARTQERNMPSHSMQPYLDSRPVATKYSMLPIIDMKPNATVPLIQQSTFNPRADFNPGNDGGPWSGYASNVNDETMLRNQVYGLQSCPQAAYIPDSSSSLYDVKWKNANQAQQPFPDLFVAPKFCPTPDKGKLNDIGYAMFNNSTRSHVKDLTK